MDSSHTTPPHSPAAALPIPHSDSEFQRYDAACVADHRSEHRPGTLILEKTPTGSVVCYSGPSSQAPAHLREIPQTLSLPGSTLIPPLANAHTHLDLTAIGLHPHDPAEGFHAWLGMIRETRPQSDAEIRDAVDRGIQLSLAGGVVAVGDIAGYPGRISLEPFRAMQAAGMLGVSFLEFFAIGTMEPARLKELRGFLKDHKQEFSWKNSAEPRLGLGPHAPYSVSPEAYRESIRLAPPGTPLSTHLAETVAERDFIAEGTGPRRDFLESLSLWDDALLDSIGLGSSPTEHLAPVLAESSNPWVLAHGNDLTDADLETLASLNASVAFCPRGHRYFGLESELGPHRWPEMLDAGVNVCLATDSIVNLDTPDRISPLDDARYLLATAEQLDPSLLLRLITVNPARALGLDPTRFEFGLGSKPLGMVEIQGANSLAGVFESQAAPRLMVF